MGKLNEGKGERWGAWGEAGACGQGRAGLGRVAGRNPTARTTTDRNPIANQNPKQDEANT
jgi:hypothetical protein